MEEAQTATNWKIGTHDSTDLNVMKVNGEEKRPEQIEKKNDQI